MNVITTSRLALVASDHPALRTRSRELAPQEVLEVLDLKFQYQAHKLMKARRGIGLAANQVGDTRRWFVWKWGVVINPEIVSCSSELESLPEGCLSFPGLECEVARPRAISVIYTGGGGVRLPFELDGLAARVFQHEFDHLNGICIDGGAPLTGMIQSAA